ncbi:DUF4417 domain-containing protein [Kibdelosporangium aridum]|uniref:DUF4417 domain-containing protein n=1 Tax=Kibdelosporangium aridum TaxID=2030 RepID=A0A1W2EX85_KIBAR|nr:DUF4417 domain-containing protein [Kibdelosporangium aridum]SMD14182.1 protein of unknown function [Kibdelosporangium aridum]
MTANLTSITPPDRPTEPARLLPTLQLGATRSSHRWTEQPGNWDRLNTRALFDSDNQWGIPALPPARFEPARLVAYNDRRACTTATGTGAAVHFFLDDYRFETVWSKPERGLSRCRTVGTALTPDFSLWSNMPRAMQLWQVYRSRWCGAWLLHHGITVIPTVSWSTPETYDFTFAGIATGSVVAVSTVGTRRDPDARQLFAAGFTEMLTRLRPSTVLCYGTLSTCSVGVDVPVGTTIRCYPSRWDGRAGDR